MEYFVQEGAKDRAVNIWFMMTIGSYRILKKRKFQKNSDKYA